MLLAVAQRFALRSALTFVDASGQQTQSPPLQLPTFSFFVQPPFPANEFNERGQQQATTKYHRPPVDDNVRTTSRRWAAIKSMADIGACNLIANTNARGGSHSVLLRWLVNRSQRMDDAISWTHVGVSQILRFRYGAIFAIHNQSNYLIIHLIDQVDRRYRGGGGETRKNPFGL